MIKVIYHANCSDGFCSAWLTHFVFPEAEFIPCQYGDEPPDVTDDRVYILDFSFDRETLLRMKDQAKTILVLDHHKTAQKDLEGLDFCVFDMNRSGARMTLDYLLSITHGLIHQHLSTDKINDIVNYVQDRDLWKWELPHSKEINSAIRSYPMNFHSWGKLLDKDLIVEGEAIERYRRNIINSIKKNALYVSWNKETIPFVECSTTEMLSEVVGELAEDYPFAVGWFSLDGCRDGYVFSMRSREDGKDVSEICKRLGGGGHRNAAGCKVPGFHITSSGELWITSND